MPVQAPAQRTGVFLCDDVSDLRYLFRLGVEDEPDMEVVGEAADGAAGVEGVASTQPDVMLLDLAMPGMDGLETIPRVHALGLGVRIIVVSGYDHDKLASEAVRRCATRFLSKSATMSEIVEAIREVAAGPPKVCAA